MNGLSNYTDLSTHCAHACLVEMGGVGMLVVCKAKMFHFDRVSLIRVEKSELTT